MKYNIKYLQTDPHHPNQNPAERRLQEVKKTVLTIMDRVGAPEELWHLCMQYMTYLLNRMAYPLLKNRTPIEVVTGQQPDVSALMRHHFYEPILYYDKIFTAFPDSREKLGWWVGVAETTGDALTYKILTTENEVINRSVVRAADNPLHPNQRVRFRIDEQEEPLLVSESDFVDPEKLSLPTV